MDFNKWIEKHFNDITWPEAILAFILLTISLIVCEVLYWNPTLKQLDKFSTHRQNDYKNYEYVILPNDDFRLARLQDAPADSRKEIKLAWISGSSSVVKNKKRRFDGAATYNLPLLLSQNINRIGNKSLRVYDYTMSGGMSIDVLNRVGHSIETLNPDIIIIAVNPFWALQEKRLIHQSYYSKALLLNEVSWSIDTWPLLSFLTPMHFMLKSAQYKVSSIERRHLGHQLLDQWVGRLKIPFPESTKRAKSTPSVIKDWLRINSTQSGLEFTNNSSRYQYNAFMYNSLARSRMAENINKLAVANLAKSNIPTLIYVAPVAPNLWSISNEARLQKELIVENIERVFLENKADNIVFDKNTVDLLQQSDFRDFLHIKNEERVLNYLIQKIGEITKQDIIKNEIASRFHNDEE